MGECWLWPPPCVKRRRVFFLATRSHACCTLGKPLDVPMEVGPTFEEYAGKLEAAQQAEDAKERAETTARRKLMERVAVHAAQYQMLAGKNARMVAAAKDYQYYALPKLYVVRPVMTQAEMEGFIAKNQEILDIATALVAKNEKVRGARFSFPCPLTTVRTDCGARGQGAGGLR